MRKIKFVLHWLLGIFYIGAGIVHFVTPDFYLGIMPPYLPWHRELVFVSGVCEVLLGILVLIPRFTVLAAWGIIALLIAVFPANIHMAFHPDLYQDVSPVLLWLRLPLQGVFIAWAYWYTRRPSVASAQEKVS